MATSEASTVIGEAIVITGNLSGDEDLSVRGRIEGAVTLTKALVIEQSGVVKAEIQAKSCVISGAVSGNVTATDSVEITKEGRMVGDITARRVIIADGASFRGRIEMGEVDVGEQARPVAARPISRPTLAPRNDREDGTVSLAAKAVAAVKPPAPPMAVSVGAMKRKVVVRRK